MCHDLAPALSVHSKKQYSTVTQFVYSPDVTLVIIFVPLLNLVEYVVLKAVTIEMPFS